MDVKDAEIGKRVKEIRQKEEKTQSEFADIIGLSRNYVAVIEMGQRVPSDRTISDICRIFRISEPWLRTGQGEMYLPRPREEQIAELVGQALTGSNEFKKAVIQMICSRTEKELQVLEAALRSIYENL